MLSRCFHFVLICFAVQTFAQSPTMLRSDQASHTYDRMEILKIGDTTLINGIHHFDRKILTHYLQAVYQKTTLSDKDRYDILHVLADNREFLPMISSGPDSLDAGQNGLFRSGDLSEKTNTPTFVTEENFIQKPIFKHFYKDKANFIYLKTPSFKLVVNPVVQIHYLNEVNNANTIFQNTRGVDIRGYIDDKVYFYTQLLDNQRSFLSFIQDRIFKFGTIPGQGSWKNYESGVISSLKGYDYFFARAYIGFNPVKSINIEFGHGNHFLGNGVRSLLLSDFSHNYLYLKLNTRIWKFQYQNIFAELSPTSTLFNVDDKLLPKKYMATHYLAFKPNKNFEIGLFESVIFSRQDHFEFQYLNPVILYRAVEHFLDSPDNVMLGLNLKWNATKGISLYGQLLLDEFKLSEIKNNSGWYANKFGGQLGIKYINVANIDHLDLQVEYNIVRPYTYAHRDTLDTPNNVSIANYSHVNQPLAHPLGANFKEWIAIVRYKPTNHLYLQSKLLLTNYGDDGIGQNWGGNILLPTGSRQMDYNNVIGQGIATKVFAVNVDVSYELFHNYFIDVYGMWRQTTTDIIQDQHMIGLGIRINMAQVNYDY